MISVLQEGTITRMPFVHLAARCAVGALLCTGAFAMPQNQAGQTNSPSAYVTTVRPAQVGAHTITLPMDEGNDIRFTRLSTENGLSQTKVQRIVQDNQGFIWLGTQHGLNRYDGYSFKVFAHDPANPNSLSGVYVQTIFKDRDGMLWIGCDQFLNRLEPSIEIFTKYSIPTVVHISQDTTGMLWFATRGSGLFSLDPKTGRTHQYVHDAQDASSLSSNELISSEEDRTGRFWVSSDKGLDEFDRGKGVVTLHIEAEGKPGSIPAVSFYEDHHGVFWIRNLYHDMLSVLDRKTNTVTNYAFDDREPSGKVTPYITFMTDDQNGDLCLGTHGAGLLKFDREHQRFIRFHNDISDPGSLPQNDVENLFADREGDMWASLGRMGIIHFGTSPLPFKKLPRDPSNPNSKIERFAGALYADHQGILWLGTPDALNRIDREAEQYTSYHETGWPAGTIDVIALGEDAAANLWVGTYGHGLLRFDRTTGGFKVYRHDPARSDSLSSDIVTRFLVDHNGTFWVATADGLNRFDPATEHFTPYKVDPYKLVQSYLDIVEDREGILWLGTDAVGLHQFDPATGHFTVYQHDMNRADSLSNNRVNSIHFDRSGAMWLGTQDGLDKFDPKTGTFTAYLRQEGLPGSAIGCILEDGHGDFWMSTNNGVTKFDPHTQYFKNYSTADGLPGPDLTGWGACSKSATGEMFFGGFSGATTFFPDKVTESSYVPPIVLTDFRLFGIPVKVQSGAPLQKPINYTETITLSHNQNIFSVGFSALSYLNAPTNRYRYMLEGLEERWNDVGSDQRLATYTTLAPGDYTFHVQGATSRGAWGEPGVTLHIRILPAWYQRLWFYLICAITCLALLWSAYVFRIRHLRDQERKLWDVVETIPTFVWTALPDGSIDFSNHYWEEFSGLSPDKTAGSGWLQALHPEDRDRYAQKWLACVSSGEPFEIEVRFRRANGEYRWFLIRAVPMRGLRGKISKWYGTTTDIEDRKRAELLRSELAHVNRITTMGELLASISHELKQPITASVVNASTALRWLKHDPPNVDEASKVTNKIIESGRLAAQIIDRLRSLYKNAMPKREPLEMNDVIDEMIGMLRAEATLHEVSIFEDLTRNLPNVSADRVQIQQVLMNLMLNGIEAMNEAGGILTVKSQPTGNGEIQVSVSDTGPGLPTSEAGRIFDPFFTTKPQGSGMGLAISKSIIESHGGRIWADVDGGRGATFHFTLPVDAAASSALPD